MKTSWTQAGRARKMVAPLSLIVSAFAPVRDVRRTLTPQLRTDRGDTSLLLIDLGGGRNRLGGSCLAQVYGSLGREAPDCDDPARLASFFAAIVELRAAGLALAYHDRSDGGLFATVAEMAFAGHCGVELDLAADCCDQPPRRCTAKSSARSCRFAARTRRPCGKCSNVTASRVSRASSVGSRARTAS